MTENNSEDKETILEPVENKNSESKPGSINSIIYMIFYVLVIVSIFLAGKSYLDNRLHKSDLGKLQLALDKIDHKLQQAETNLKQLNELNVIANKQIENLVARQEEYDAYMRRIGNDDRNSNQEWALAEVEYLILIASHRLVLESDTGTALAALEAADTRLRDMNNPGLTDIRRQLATDMNALRAVQQVDITGLSLFLADYVKRVDSLPTKSMLPEKVPDKGLKLPGSTDQSWWRKLLASFWYELKEVIVISNEGKDAVISLLPEQSYYLYQNLRLQLETIRYAVMLRDTETMNTSIAITRNWLTKYFDSSDSGVNNLLDSLSRMSALELEQQVPDISSSLETVRAIIKDISKSEPTTDADKGTGN